MALGDNTLPAPHLDEVDLKILKFLSKDSKMSYSDMGKKLNLSGPAIHARVKKMEKTGVIKGYTIRIDPERVGQVVTSLVRVQTGKTRCRDIAKELGKIPEIHECYTVSGEDDLSLKIRTRTPMELQSVLDKLKVQNLIEKSITQLVMETHFERVLGE
jgi:Lrp/AsnC family leucine-responsive transcriptional regulator